MAVSGVKGEPYTITDVYGTPFAETATAPVCDRWTPETHSLYPKSFKAIIMTFLLSIRRCGFKHLPGPILSSIFSFINPPTCCLVEINTSFPSEVKNNRIYGGALLVQIEKSKENDQTSSSDSVVLKLRVTYTDRAGKEQGNETTLTFDTKTNSESKNYYSSLPVRKAILLQRYVYATQQFLIAHHEKKDTDLPKKRLAAYSQTFSREAQELGDEELIKTAQECQNFVREHCSETPSKKPRMMMGAYIG